MNINRIYNSDEKFVGYKAVAVISWNKMIGLHSISLRMNPAICFMIITVNCFAMKTHFALQSVNVQVRTIDHIDAIQVNENSTSYNRLYGRAVNNSESIGDIDINVKQKVIGGIWMTIVVQFLIVYVGSLMVFLVKEILENKGKKMAKEWQDHFGVECRNCGKLFDYHRAVDNACEFTL